MVKTIHILTEGFHSSNGRAFLFPILRNRALLAQDYGLSVKIHTQRVPQLADCDVLLVDSKFYKPYWASPRRDEAIGHFANEYAQAGASYFIDLNDSTGWYVPYVLPYVTRYVKSQLLKDRSAYTRPMYERRPISDYYHRKQGVVNDEEIWSLPVGQPDHLNKMVVGWNSGLANYAMTGPWLMAAYERLGWPVLLQEPRFFFAPSRRRDIPLGYRFGLSYPQASVRYQREQLKGILDTTRYAVPTRKLNRVQFFAEMIRTQIVLSPFGFGEITLKDFETFLVGAALMKPDMSGIETWPNFFVADETYIPFSWDMEDVVAQLDRYLADDRARLRLAENGQSLYRDYVAGPSAQRRFCDYFAALMTPV